MSFQSHKFPFWQISFNQNLIKLTSKTLISQNKFHLFQDKFLAIRLIKLIKLIVFIIKLIKIY